ncbi:MAG TPA: efflux RND transporter periplasmic adaptor subunit, partial [Patescibacteria group bacterium]
MNFIKNLFLRFWALSLLKKILIGGVILLIVWYTFSQISKSTTQPQYQTATAEKGTLVTSVTASGTVASVTNSTITTQATGIISQVYVANGDYVQQGQKIATIALDSTSLQKQQAAYASYLSAQNTLTTAQAKINSLQSALFKANQSFVNDKGVNNPTDQQKADPKYVEENADWLQAEADYKNQQGVISQAQVALSAAWLSYTQTSADITAPIAGNVENLAITPGFPLVANTSSSNNNSNQTPITIGNIKLQNGFVTATVNLTEIDVTSVKIGQKVTLTLDAFAGK